MKKEKKRGEIPSVDPTLAAKIVECLQAERTPMPRALLAERTGIPAWLLDRQLPGMINDAQVAVSRKGGVALPEMLGQYHGTIRCTRRGDARVQTADGVYDVPDTACGGALHGDEVLVSVREGTGQARVLRILQHANAVMIGTVRVRGGKATLAPDDARLPDHVALAHGLRGAAEGDKVVADVVEWPEQGSLRAVVREVLGDADDPHVCLRAIVRQYGLRETMADAVAAEAAELAARPVTAEGRLDLRALTLCTIDGADAQDFDDAVSLEALPDGGWQLGVHIADVSAYVPQGGALDRDAYARGTSVYLPGWTLPMLPEALSNGACSLRPDVDRWAMSLMMEMKDGRVGKHALHRSIIRSKARLTYTEVNQAFAGEAVSENVRPVLPMLEQMRALTAKIRARREARGSIDFDLQESEIVVDAQGVPVSVAPRVHGDAERMIEDCMLTANETIAADARGMELPFLYRVHEDPDPERLATFAQFVGSLGYAMPEARNGVRPGMLRDALAAFDGREESPMVAKLLLRAMKKARYAAEPLGHFGLAARDYCHFTSPIRRYPDLCIHRVLAAMLAGEIQSPDAAHMPEIATQTSTCERTAMEAERDADAMLKAFYMKRHIGEVFEGVLSGVQAWGFFVMLPSTVEGLVHVQTLSDYYTFDETRHCLVGERSRRAFRLGDRVRVRVDSVSVQEKQVRFTLEGRL